ncbi:MAG: ATP-binding protein [Spartobacteria bacterium]
MPAGDHVESAVLVLAPKDQVAQLAVRALTEADIRAEIGKDLVDLAERFDEQTNALLIAEEALVRSDLARFLEALKQQPPWSDIPVIILTTPGGGDRASVQVLETFGPAANITLLERPLRPITLVAAVKVALRARRRQRQVRDLIAERETVLASISDAFSALDRNWRYTYVNSKVAELAGMPEKEMLGKNIWDVFPDAVGGEFYDRCRRAMETREQDHFEVFYKPWGKWLETRIYPARDGIVIFRADITERKEGEALLRQNERKLQELEERSRLAVEAADVGTFDFYPPTGELQWSKRCNEIFGLPPGTKVDYASYVNCVHPQDRHIIHDTVRGVLQPGNRGRYDIEYRIVGMEDRQERWVSEKGRAILDDKGHAVRFIGTILDITASKTAAMALQRAKNDAEEANRAKDQFLAMLSHELRTPLTPVLMSVAALRRETQIGERFAAELEMIQRNIELEARLIDDLLDLTRIAHGKFELHQDAVDVHASIEHALSITSSDVSQKNLQVTKRFTATEHHCWADAARLQQVFWNLIKNAVKFTPAGGKIDISTRSEEGHHLIVEFTDSGIGIEPELQSRIFEAFEQGGRAVTTRYGGLGLGLAISKRVIDLHHGTISVRSAGRGQGATFTVTLQAMETSLLEGPAYLLDLEVGSVGPAEILLVEDHSDTARVMQRVLEAAGYSVVHAADLARAREEVLKRKFDLVISDVGLPDGSGLDLMRELSSAHALSGIAISGFGTSEDVAASKAAGFAKHLVKPVDWERLRDAIAQILTAQQNASGATR